MKRLLGCKGGVSTMAREYIGSLLKALKALFKEL